MHIGRIVGSRFRIESLIDKGSMGAVFQAWDSQRGQSCALKLLYPEGSHDEMVDVRFQDEARLISRLCHPNIVEVWAYGAEPDGTLFLAMERLHGQCLYSFLQQHGALPLDLALDLIKQIGSALHTIHLAGIVHRDLKPQNVLLIPRLGSTGAAAGASPGASPDRFVVKVIDFGLAKLLDRERAPRRGSDGMLIGTPQYLAPEGWRGISAEVDARVDQWALAVIAYRMLTGQLPYESDDNTVALGMRIHNESHTPLRELLPSIPQHVQDSIHRALQKDKRARFPSVLDFVRALHDLPSEHILLSALSNQETAPFVFPAEDADPQPYAELSCIEIDPESALAPPAKPPTPREASATVRWTQATAPTAPIARAGQPPVTQPPLARLAPAKQELHVRDRWRRRRALSTYLLPALSVLGAIAAWSSLLAGHASDRVTSHPPLPDLQVNATACSPSMAPPPLPLALPPLSHDELPLADPQAAPDAAGNGNRRDGKRRAVRRGP